jgi:hypothetical protein
MHEQDRYSGVEITWPGGLQNQRTIRERGVQVGQRGSGSLDEACQIDHLRHHRVLLSTPETRTTSRLLIIALLNLAMRKE